MGAVWIRICWKVVEYVVKRLSRRRDSMGELDKAIIFLREQYERAQRIEYINDPLAWALYQTWRHVDEPPKEPKKRIKDHVCNNDYCELE
jgi:hypothetical protein